MFENREKIFQIHSSYRFVLLSFRDINKSSDKFPAGFYLHHLSSLVDSNREKAKFGWMSKKAIHKISPQEYSIPEVVGQNLEILEKTYSGNNLGSEFGNGWDINISSGFHKTNDADILESKQKKTSWPVLEGGDIHQYIHDWSIPEFLTNQKVGLKRESKKRLFMGAHKKIYNSYRLIFRDITGPTNTRTIISTIIPPHMFHTYTLYSIILRHNGEIELGEDYLTHISYLCGVFNSLTFDFIARASIQLHAAAILKSLPLPDASHMNTIAKLAAELAVGSPEFEGFADQMGIDNKKLTVSQRIRTAAKLDALVASAYDLTNNQYKTVIDSFNLFKTNPELYNTDDITWNNKNLKEFYGEMSILALQYHNQMIIEGEKQ